MWSNWFRPCSRSSDTYSQAKRALLGALTDVVPEVLGTLEHDLLVEIQLIAAGAGTGLENGAGVVVPLKASVRLVPIDSPAEVGRVDVTGKTLLIAVKLVTNKVHLASQGRVVAHAAKVVRVSGNLGADLGGIVVGANLHGQQAGDHAHARRGAQRRRAVSRVELNGLGCQRIKVGGLDLRVGVVHLELRSGQLVGHDVQDVGLRGRLRVGGRLVKSRGRHGVEIRGHDDSVGETVG